MLSYLIEKEFKQLFRNSFLPRLILLFPCMLLIVFPWAATLEVQDVRLAIIDQDHSQTTRRLIQQIEASRYFRLQHMAVSYEEALQAIEKDQVDIILQIPDDFEKDQVMGKPAEVQIAANAINGMKGSLGSSYLAQIINRQPDAASVRYLYNPHLDYKHYMVPALMTMMLFLICGFLPALNIVSEKESGTIEQINVTPVSKVVFTLSKLIPYWLIGFFVLSVAILLAWLIYGLVPASSLSTLYIGAGIFIFLVSGVGITISNYSSTLQQAMFVTWFFVIIMLLMSGLFTPVESMPEWAQLIAALNPLKYFVEVMRTIYLRGGGIVELLPQLGALMAFAVFFNLWAVRSYRKSS